MKKPSTVEIAKFEKWREHFLKYGVKTVGRKTVKQVVPKKAA